MFQYVTYAIVALAVVIIAINIIKGLVKGLKKSVGAFVAIALSIVIAAILTAVICKPSSSFIASALDMLKGIMPDGTIQDLFSVEELGEAFSYYSSMLVAPFFFALSYILVSIIVSIIVSILVKIIPPFKKPGILLDRLDGSGVGLICGFIVTVIVLMPIVGTIDMVASLDSAGQSAESAETAENDDIKDLIHKANESKVIDVFMNMGCRPVYNAFASAKFDGEKIYLKDDLSAVLDMVDNIDAMSGELSGYGDAQIGALRNIVADLESSSLLENTVSGVFSTAAQKWLSGESFIGIEKFSAGEMLDPIVETMLEVIATSDKDTIGKDLETMTDVFAIMVKYDMFSHGDDYEAMLTQLSKEGVISELIIVVNNNPRMSPLADEITTLSIRALASTIGIPEDAEERYNLLLSEVAEVVESTYGMSGDEREQNLSSDLKKAFDEYGVEVGGEALDNITASVITDLGHLSTVEISDVEEFFMIYAIANAQADTEASRRYQSFDLLSSTESNKVLEVVVNDDGTISIDGKVLKNYNADNYISSGAYTMGSEKSDFGDAASLYSSDTMKSDLVTMEDIISTIGKYADCEDISVEAEKIEKVIGEALTTFQSIDFNKADTEEILEAVSGMLDSMSETDIFGGETAQSIFTAILQSDAAVQTIGMSHQDATNLANKIGEVISNTDSDYADATKVISDTLNALNSTTNSDLTKEEKKQATENLINNVTPDSAEILGSVVTSSMVTEMGVPKENAEAVSSALSSMLNNMADYNGTEADPDAVAKEAEAVNQILDLAINITPDSECKSLFNDGDAEGVLGVTAEEFIDLVINSEVVSATLEETIYANGYSDNPLGIPELSEGDIAQAKAALLNYYVSNGGGEELARQLQAIAAIVNIDISFN